MVQVDMFKEVHSLRFSAEFLVMSPQPLFGLQGSSARGLRRPALGLAVLATSRRMCQCGEASRASCCGASMPGDCRARLLVSLRVEFPAWSYNDVNSNVMRHAD